MNSAVAVGITCSMSVEQGVVNQVTSCGQERCCALALPVASVV